jgi:DNA modification methylase
LSVEIIEGDCRVVLKELPDQSVNCIVTSPPYFGLRDYGVENQMGLEPTPAKFVEALVGVLREARRVLRDDGTLWLNLGDSYAGSWGAQSRPNGSDVKSTLGGGSMLSARQIAAHPKGTQTGSLKNTPGLKNKDLIGIPWRVAFALQADGWYLRQDIIWHKPNPMPESVRDRPTKSHEYLFLLSKNERYYFDADAVSEPVSDWSRAALASDWQRRTDYGTPEVSGRNSVGQGYADRVRKDGRRNIRTVWTIATPMKRLRADLSPEKRAEVIQELARRGLL